MKHREFICIKDNSAEIDIGGQNAFLLHIQRAILLSLEDKNMITRKERMECEAALESRI